MTTSCTDIKHPYYEEFIKGSSGNGAGFFTGENAYRMRFVSLGEALDFVSSGGLNFVGWPFSGRKMVDFIKAWMDNQKPKIIYEEIPLGKGSYRAEEKGREYCYTWNRFDNDFDVELPYICNDACQVGGHKRTVRDLAGRVRCAHFEIKMLRPSFVRSNRYGDKIDYFEEYPFDPDPDDYIDKDGVSCLSDEVLEQYQEECKKFEDEEPSCEVYDYCYSVISDAGVYLPLQTVLDRLSVSRVMPFGLPFSGFTLANYVKAWFSQPGEKRFLSDRHDDYKVFPDFHPIGSDD